MLRRTETGWLLRSLPERSEYHLSRGEWIAETLGNVARQRLAEDPDHIVVVDGNRRWTRRELYDAALRLGSALTRRGLKRGSVVSVQLPNWSEACVVNLACAIYGFVLNPLLPMYRERELSFMLSQCGTDALFIPGKYRGVDYAALIARTPYAGKQGLTFTVRAGSGEHPRYEELLAENAGLLAPPEVDPADAKMVLYTSGSTGRPKGVLHNHYTLHAIVRQAAAFWGIDAADTFFIPSPVGHIGGSIYAFEFPWITGATAFLMESWDAEQAVALIDRERATFCAGATPFLRGLLDCAIAANSRLPSLRRFVCGGANVPLPLVEAASRHFDRTVVSRAYGSSEVPLICPGVRDRSDEAWGCTTDGEIMADLRLVDPDGKDVAPGADGDILVRSRAMFMGYLDSDDEQGQFTDTGYFRMGDVGRVVERRFIEITGRKKEIIIRMGENISPREIENALLAHDGIEQVAIVGTPDQRTGERAVAFLMLKPGFALTLADLQAFLAKAGMARQKFPEELHIVESLPMNSIGKVLKEELKSRLMEGRLSPSGGIASGRSN